MTINDEGKTEMTNDPAYEVCKLLLAQLPKNKTVNNRSPSAYHMKHMAERLSDLMGEHVYVPHDTMRQAAFDMGYPIKDWDRWCGVGVSAVAYRKMYDRFYRL